VSFNVISAGDAGWMYGRGAPAYKPEKMKNIFKGFFR